jgi:hypothetical protein
MTPRRPYRVIGMVQTRVYQNQATAAEQSLMREACDVGADAIIVDARDAMAYMQEPAYLGATAIAYTDGAASTQ